MSAARLTADKERGRSARTKLQYATREELERISDEEIGSAIACVEFEHPDFTHTGWVASGLPRPASVASHPAFQKQVRAVLLFIQKHAMPQEAINSSANSRRLAEIASAWCGRNVMASRISHGAFIIGAVIAGYTPARYPGSGLSCSFNMRLDLGAWLYDLDARQIVAEIADVLVDAFGSAR